MKKTTALLAALALALPLGAAHAADADPSTAPKTTTPKKTRHKKIAHKVLPKRMVKKMEEKQPIAAAPEGDLSPEDLKVAQQVYTGAVPCELGEKVSIEADPGKAGYFWLSHAGVRYRMHPVESRTGAVRLEDPQRGAMWLQLGNKSMLMNQKLGQRLADDCQTTAQTAFAEDMKKHPPKPLFEGADPQK